jgi:hypothetical protein
MWKMAPEVKISFDSRYEVAYPLWRMDEDDVFYEARDGWEKILQKYPTDIVLLRSDLKVVKPMENESGWRKVYSDPRFVLFARSELELPVVETNQPAPDGTFP